jgi:hypothetical protein
MKMITLFAAVGAMALAPGVVSAAAPSGNATGWDHFNGPDSTGQPGVECGEDEAPNIPGQSDAARGSPFNEEGIAGTKYAGEQPQNSRNSASVSQYDAACLIHPREHE